MRENSPSNVAMLMYIANDARYEQSEKNAWGVGSSGPHDETARWQWQLLSI